MSVARRDLLSMMAVLLGASAIPAAALSAAASPPYLDPARGQLLVAIADTMIPQTDTPGAVQAGVPATLDTMLRNWASPAQRARLQAALDAIDAAARAGGATSFVALAANARHALLAAHDAAHFAAGSDYRLLRDLVVLLYYISEPGATVELRYEHRPGAWEPSIPITPDTRAWAGVNAF